MNDLTTLINGIEKSLDRIGYATNRHYDCKRALYQAIKIHLAQISMTDANFYLSSLQEKIEDMEQKIIEGYPVMIHPGRIRAAARKAREECEKTCTYRSQKGAAAD